LFYIGTKIKKYELREALYSMFVHNKHVRCIKIDIMQKQSKNAINIKKYKNLNNYSRVKEKHLTNYL